VNVTLLFDVGVYAQVREAWLRGLMELDHNGGSVREIASVASFFVSRVDTKVDSMLGVIGSEEALSLRGTAAVANAVLAWDDVQQLSTDERWQHLASRGAQEQRLLWASTGTKNPDYSDVKYVDELVAP